MTFRGVYRDGVIIPDQLLELSDGERVDFSLRKVPTDRDRPVTRTRKSSPSKSAEQRVAAFMKAFGVRKDQRSIKGKSSASVARQLRTLATGSRFRD